jgi:hypothetical protein
MKLFKVFLVMILLSVFPLALFAEESGEYKTRGDYLTIKLAVISPGDELYLWWGHLGVLIEDSFTGSRDFIDYGVFSFNEKDFFTNFAFGLLWYTSTVTPADRVINYYKSKNRDITLYTLDLDSAEKEEFYKITQFNITPEHSTYLYNHYKYNCVTRATDGLDSVLRGQFYEKASQQEGRFTLRQEIRRFVSKHAVWDLILNFLMGQVIDKPISLKEEMFLPSETGMFLETFRYTDSNGVEKPLVSNIEQVYVSSGRSPILDAPKSNVASSLIAGFVVALALYFLCFFDKMPPLARRRFLGICNSLLAVILGAFGTVLCFMEFFTNHDYTYENSNVLFSNPLLLIAVPFGIMYALGKNEKKLKIYLQVIRVTWTYVVLSVLIVMIIKVSPNYYQDNWALLVLILPPALVLSKAGILCRFVLSKIRK